MKTNQFCLFASLFLALLISLPNATRAQVKIGTNHQTIDPNSNFEVEATGGNKTMVNKATGQLTIQDGTQGAGKILTSDANGGASWKQLGGQAGAGFDSYLVPSAAFSLPQNGPNVFPFPDVTITEAGTYMAVIRTFGNATTANALAFYTMIRKNGSTAGQDNFEWYAIAGANGVFGVSGTMIFTAVAGDVVTVGFQNGYANNLSVPAVFLPRNNVRFIKIR